MNAPSRMSFAMGIMRRDYRWKLFTILKDHKLSLCEPYGTQQDDTKRGFFSTKAFSRDLEIEKRNRGHNHSRNKGSRAIIERLLSPSAEANFEMADTAIFDKDERVRLLTGKRGQVTVDSDESSFSSEERNKSSLPQKKRGGPLRYSAISHRQVTIGNGFIVPYDRVATQDASAEWLDSV